AAVASDDVVVGSSSGPGYFMPRWDATGALVSQAGAPLGPGVAGPVSWSNLVVDPQNDVTICAGWPQTFTNQTNLTCSRSDRCGNSIWYDGQVWTSPGGKFVIPPTATSQIQVDPAGNTFGTADYSGSYFATVNFEISPSGSFTTGASVP